MPRYFFDLTNNGDSVADEVGEEFELVEAARVVGPLTLLRLAGRLSCHDRSTWGEGQEPIWDCAVCGLRS
jgi:hypothetical protein